MIDEDWEINIAQSFLGAFMKHKYCNSTELYHYGVKGMKWGVRHDDPPDYTTQSKHGERIEFRKDKYGLVAKGIRRLSPKLAKEQDRTRMYHAYVNGKKVGSITLYKESRSSVNVVWLDVKKKERGKGYAQAILDSSISRAKLAGFKQMTLEVPGISPDARHIYEKRGFVAGKQISSSDDVWGGLTKMKKKL